VKKNRIEVVVLIGSLLGDGELASRGELCFEAEQRELGETFDRRRRPERRVVLWQRVTVAVETRGLSRVDLEIVERVLDRRGRRDLHAAPAPASIAVSAGARRSGKSEANQKESRNGCAIDETKTQSHRARLTWPRLPGQSTTRPNDGFSYPFGPVVPCLSDNCAYLTIENGRAAVVDPFQADPVLRAVDEARVELTEIWLTHHHWDHVGGIKPLIDECPMAHVPGSPYDADDQRIPRQTDALSDGDSFDFGGVTVG